jgi:hypothetical protein
MKKLAIAIVLASTVAASTISPKIPQEMRGQWCFSEVRGSSVSIFTRQCRPDTHMNMTAVMNFQGGTL